MGGEGNAQRERTVSFMYEPLKPGHRPGEAIPQCYQAAHRRSICSAYVSNIIRTLHTGSQAKLDQVRGRSYIYGKKPYAPQAKPSSTRRLDMRCFARTINILHSSRRSGLLRLTCSGRVSTPADFHSWLSAHTISLCKHVIYSVHSSALSILIVLLSIVRL